MKGSIIVIRGQVGGWEGGANSPTAEIFFGNLGGGFWVFDLKGGVKSILLYQKKFSGKGELKIFEQGGANLPLGHTLNWGVQMKKISFGEGKKHFSCGILNTCPRMQVVLLFATVLK